MSENANNNIWSVLAGMGIKFSTVIYAATIAGGLYANWRLQDDAIKDIETAGKSRSEQIVALSTRLYAVERDMAVMNRDYQNLRDAVTELRRQSRLTTPVPPP